LLAYHDRSDGGLIVTLCEMAFAARCGLKLNLEVKPQNLLDSLFAEEAGAVIQVRVDDLRKVRAICRDEGLDSVLHDVGRPQSGDSLKISAGDEFHEFNMVDLMMEWSATSHQIQRLRDNPDCADEELQGVKDWNRPVLRPQLTFSEAEPLVLSEPPMVATGARPAVAILREQGVNGQTEMAAAFHLAGFESVDVHMSDLVRGDVKLDHFRGLVACGGFSYGDVLGAGRGWATSILMQEALRAQFTDFFSRNDRFALGVCNGCQMLSALRTIIPGAQDWPDFATNLSEQFEARLSLVRVRQSKSLFFKGMAGSLLPVASAHGEGRVDFGSREIDDSLVALNYSEADGTPATRYPRNPNGSPQGITGLCNEDGRVTILMPHPERTLRVVNYSWAPDSWQEASPWQRMFKNARNWVG
jgi:phosphoribosylformylglycinamidine synthase